MDTEYQPSDVLFAITDLQRVAAFAREDDYTTAIATLRGVILHLENYLDELWEARAYRAAENPDGFSALDYSERDPYILDDDEYFLYDGVAIYPEED